jgi:phosphoribosyl-ATP pyrophosphohydrolase/phosphoribosyl-AMP cyclohydrolase
MRKITDGSKVDFKKAGGLVPAVIQDLSTQKVLMLGYMNADALEKTFQTGLVTFYSRSKQALWTKGETSGNSLAMQAVYLDCDADTLLVMALPKGPTCHTGDDTCFGDDNKGGSFAFLEQLEEVIQSRKEASGETSYTKRLFESGILKMAQKVGEEGVETTIEAVAGNKDRYKEEAADLLFHLIVLTRGMDMEMKDIIEVLQKRHTR